MEALSKERLDKYFDITGRALKKAKIVDKGEVKNWKESADDFFDMAQRYYDDACHFNEQGRHMDAFAALNYAHGWLDAGARLGLFDVDGDNELFTVDADE